MLLILKTSSPHLSGKKWTTAPYSPDLAPSDFHLFLHLKKFLGGKRFDDDDDLKDAVQKWLTSQAAAFYEEDYKNLCPVTISASLMTANMWKNCLKNVESDNNKVLYETLLIFSQRNSTYFPNKSRMSTVFTVLSMHLYINLIWLTLLSVGSGFLEDL